MSARDVIADVAFEGKVLGHPVRFEMGHSKADAILSALRSAGFAVVPVEPTLEMIAAWDRVARPGLHAFEIRFKAMITAAQEDSRE